MTTYWSLRMSSTYGLGLSKRDKVSSINFHNMHSKLQNFKRTRYSNKVCHINKPFPVIHKVAFRNTCMILYKSC